MGRVFFNTRKDCHSLTGAYTVLSSESGKVFTLNAAAGAAITLPAVGNAAGEMGEGWNCRFYTGTLFATSDWVITATDSDMRGVISELATGAANGTVAGTTITFELGADSLGDWVELTCDGTHIFINGLTTTADAITLA